MDPRNRFERRKLRDVLVAQDVLTEELADELIESARQNHEPFGAVIVESGHLTAWDLAKTVATHYQLPFLPLAGFRFDRELTEDIPAATLYQYCLVPVGRFGKVRSFAVIEPPTRECISALQAVCGSHVFFFVAESTEVQRLLRENIKVVDTKADTAWEAIFDEAEQSVGTEGD